MVVIPALHDVYGTGESGVIAIKPMTLDNPDDATGNERKMCGNANNSLSGVTGMYGNMLPRLKFTIDNRICDLCYRDYSYYRCGCDNDDFITKNEIIGEISKTFSPNYSNEDYDAFICSILPHESDAYYYPSSGMGIDSKSGYGIDGNVSNPFYTADLCWYYEEWEDEDGNWYEEKYLSRDCDGYYDVVHDYPQQYFAPSPYLENGNRNPSHHSTEKSSNNCLSFFNGKELTEKLITLHTSQSDWKTSSSIKDGGYESNYNTSKHNGYCAPACCAWRYHTIGTNQGDWYFPADGEISYLVARDLTIRNSIEKIRLLYDNNAFLPIEIWSLYSHMNLYTGMFDRQGSVFTTQTIAFTKM